MKGIHSPNSCNHTSHSKLSFSFLFFFFTCRGWEERKANPARCVHLTYQMNMILFFLLPPPAASSQLPLNAEPFTRYFCQALFVLEHKILKFTDCPLE
mmetsp:Transcript_14222/g.27663  ORF Transcript_14222/g.27663 Transcript_14222/m.27663 type:complete len:98 (-) Transcript_14222:29-322(-)